VNGGLIWVVAGVWTVRSVWGVEPGYAWGIACLGSGARWGTLSVGDVETAARIFGPAAAAGPALVRLGVAVAVAAALVSEGRLGGLQATSWALRAAAMAAILALVAVAFAPGPGRTGLAPSLVWWAVVSALTVVVVVAFRRVAQRVPGWLPVVAAAGGIALAMAVS
jgi:hypothetical protein